MSLSDTWSEKDEAEERGKIMRQEMLIFNPSIRT